MTRLLSLLTLVMVAGIATAVESGIPENPTPGPLSDMVATWHNNDDLAVDGVESDITLNQFSGSMLLGKFVVDADYTRLTVPNDSDIQDEHFTLSLGRVFVNNSHHTLIVGIGGTYNQGKDSVVDETEVTTTSTLTSTTTTTVVIPGTPGHHDHGKHLGWYKDGHSVHGHPCPGTPGSTVTTTTTTSTSTTTTVDSFNKRDINGNSLDGMAYFVAAQRINEGKFLTTELLVEGMVDTETNFGLDAALTQSLHLGKLVTPFGGIRYQFRSENHYRDALDSAFADNEEDFWLVYGLGVGPVAFTVSHDLDTNESVGAISLMLVK